MPAPLIISRGDVVNRGEEIDLRISGVHGEGVRDLHRALHLPAGQFREHPTEQIDRAVTARQHRRDLVDRQHRLLRLLPHLRLQLLLIAGGQFGQLVQAYGGQIQQDRGDVVLVPVLLGLDAALPRGHQHLLARVAGQLRRPALGNEPLGDRGDDPAGPHRRITQSGLHLKSNSALPRLTGHPGTGLAAIDHGLRRAEIVPVQIRIRDGLQQMDVEELRGGHGVSLSASSVEPMSVLSVSSSPARGRRTVR